MSTFHPEEKTACVRYYYLPARNKRCAEIIEVLNSDSDTIKVPTREEDIRLRSFFKRELSRKETEIYVASQTWKVFTSWEELELDHIKFSLPTTVLEELLSYRLSCTLQEEIAA
ncbi:hypothetical protein [Pontibacter rugosus]|uniref:WYL domain-containing protein n=1 Tax=Pontibacter rugosus TaxID=1745966 RepID=A0ABW3SSB4_9BACT